MKKYTLYHGTHESLKGNLIMEGQCSFTIHQWQFSVHDRHQDRHTESKNSLSSLGMITDSWAGVLKKQEIRNKK